MGLMACTTKAWLGCSISCLRNLYIDSHSGSTTLLSYYLCIKCAFTLILASICYVFNSHFSRGEIESQCDFDLHVN